MGWGPTGEGLLLAGPARLNLATLVAAVALCRVAVVAGLGPGDDDAVAAHDGNERNARRHDLVQTNHDRGPIVGTDHEIAVHAADRHVELAAVERLLRHGVLFGQQDDHALAPRPRRRRRGRRP